MMIDVRSDTFTQPNEAMLQAMHQAITGDDVFSEDPTINALEEMVANMFGMEAAMFAPSGTMTNQIAINVHTSPGDEVICDELSHVYIYEGGGIAFNSGCQVRPLVGNRGTITAAQVQAAINPIDLHKASTTLVCLENTANRGGGSCYHFDELLAIKKLCAQQGLALHLDGARLWNALVAKQETAQQYGSIFNSISVCLSKGLGAPVGSLLVGQKTFIHAARRIRKKLGGGMRQAGYLAAAGIYALQNNIERLAQDHAHAAAVALAWQQKEFVTQVLPTETNIVIIELKQPHTATQLVEALQQKNILCLPISTNAIRMVFHLNVTPTMVDAMLQVIEKMKWL